MCAIVCNAVLTFRLPSPEELQKAGREERMNIFRRYFASSRYNRLLIQQVLVRSAGDSALAPEVEQMERLHRKDFSEMVKKVKKYGYYDEFITAVGEEDRALQKIIELYKERMKIGG